MMIYMFVLWKRSDARAKNLLFINQHNLTFKEEAAEYGWLIRVFHPGGFLTMTETVILICTWQIIF